MTIILIISKQFYSTNSSTRKYQLLILQIKMKGAQANVKEIGAATVIKFHKIV